MPNFPLPATHPSATRARTGRDGNIACDFHRCHRRKSKARARRGLPHEKNRREDVFEQTASGLVNMGFREKEARHAVDLLRERHRTLSPSIESLLREALVLLAP